MRRWILNGLVGLAAVVCTGRAQAADWPQFRGPTGQGHTAERDLPTKWNAKGEGVAWKVELPKASNPWSSPVVSGGKVFLTFVDAKDVRKHWVAAYATADGKELWRTDVPSGPWTDSKQNGYPTPVVEGDRLYVVFGSAVVACLGVDGKLHWKADLPSYSFDVAMSSSPVVWGDLVILLCDQTGKKSNLIAFDKKTGGVRYDVPRPDAGFAHSTPIVAKVNGQEQLLVAMSKGLQGVDPATGRVLWLAAGKGDAVTPASADGFVYSDSGRGNEGIAVDLSKVPPPADAVAKVEPAWKTGKLKESLGSPTIVGPHVYRQVGDALHCYELKTGKLVYETDKLAGGNSRISPVATSDGLLYFCSGGRTFIVKAGPAFELVAMNDLEDKNDASAAVANGRIYLRGAKYLWCIAK